MKKRSIVGLGIFILLFSLGGQALAADPCPDNGGTKFVVDTALDAAEVADGYVNSACELIIETSVVPTVTPLVITAKTITIQGPDVINPTNNVEIINPLGSSDIRITAQGGDIKISEAVIKAPNVVKVICTAPGCMIDIKLSEIIASSTLAFGAPGGSLDIVARGNVDIRTSTIYGGANLLVRSQTGSVVWICKPGEGGCKDPFVSNKAVELCDTAPPGGDGVPDFPCTVTFADAKALKEVCIQAPGVRCGGGSIELHILAELDINIEESTIEGTGSFRIFSHNGRLLAKKAVLTAKSFNIGIQGNGTSPSIDFSEAKLTSSSNMRIVAGSSCPGAPALCINLQDAELTAKKGSNFPNLNGDSNPPYDNNTTDTAAECAPKGPAVVDKGNIKITAANGNGVIDVCDALVN